MSLFKIKINKIKQFNPKAACQPMLHSSGYWWVVRNVSQWLRAQQACCEANSWEENTGVLTQTSRSHCPAHPQPPPCRPGSWGHSWPQRGSVQEGRLRGQLLPSPHPCQGHSLTLPPPAPPFQPPSPEALVPSMSRAQTRAGGRGSAM